MKQGLLLEIDRISFLINQNDKLNLNEAGGQVIEKLFLRIVEKDVIKGLMNDSEKKLFEKFFKQGMKNLTESEIKDLSKFISSENGKKIINELKKEVESTTLSAEKAALNSRISKLEKISESKPLITPKSKENILKGFKEGWDTPSSILKVVKAVTPLTKTKLNMLTKDEIKRFAMWTTLGTNVLPSELKDVVKRLGYTGVVGKLGGEWFKRYLKLTGFVMAYNFLITLAKDSVTPGAEYKGPIQALIIRMINAFEFPSIKWTTPAWIVLPEVLELLNNSLIGVPYESFIEKLQNKYNEYLQLWSNAKEKISKKSIVNKVKYDNTIDGLIKWMKEVKKLNLSNSDLPYVKSIGNNIYTYEDADNKVYKYEYTGTTFKDKLK